MIGKEKQIMILSVAAFMSLIITAFFFQKDAALSMNLVFIGIMFLSVPYSLYKFFEFKKIRRYENEFPNFLRDLAESQRAGLTLIQAINLSSRSDYGTLTAEIRKMNNQISWNIPLEKVMNDFGERMKRSRIIFRSIMIIQQANKSGGNIEDSMESLADNIESIRDVYEEKNTLLNQQVMMMYAIFFIFAAITISLIVFLMPMLQTQTKLATSATEGLSLIGNPNPNPCYECYTNLQNNPSCFGCSMFNAIGTSFDFGKREEASTYYKSLFFAMIIIQGFCSGLIAGQIGADSIAAGVKHSLIMVISGFVIFMFMAKTGII